MREGGREIENKKVRCILQRTRIKRLREREGGRKQVKFRESGREGERE